MNKNKMRKYYAIYLLGFENALEYRVNYLFNLLSIFFPIVMQYFVWSAIFAGKPSDTIMFGLTYSQAIIYTLCSGFIARMVGTGCHYQISQDIKNGTLNQFLVQPVKYIIYQVFRSIGEKIVELIIVFVVMLLFVLVIAPQMGLDLTLCGIGMFLIALIPAMILNFLLFLSVSMIAFWIIEVGRLYTIIDILVAIVSGSIFPLSIFGDKAAVFFRFLPFTYTTYFLANTMNGSLSWGAFWSGVGMQLLWIGIFLVMCKIAWSNGLKKYVAVGG